MRLPSRFCASDSITNARILIQRAEQIAKASEDDPKRMPLIKSYVHRAINQLDLCVRGRESLSGLTRRRRRR